MCSRFDVGTSFVLMFACVGAVFVVLLHSRRCVERHVFLKIFEDSGLFINER